MADTAPKPARRPLLPLTDADRRFFALRDSGYTGPIDKDGNAVADTKAAQVARDLRD